MRRISATQLSPGEAQYFICLESPEGGSLPWEGTCARCPLRSLLRLSLPVLWARLAQWSWPGSLHSRATLSLRCHGGSGIAHTRFLGFLCVFMRIRWDMSDCSSTAVSLLTESKIGP
jgi:hypothetical protein